jgi:hypothetical protein
MFNRLKKFFSKEKSSPPSAPDANPAPTAEEKAAEEWYFHKSRLMDEMLGPQHNVVMHAIFPCCVGGGLDLYYYGSGIPGTAVATKELSELPNQGLSNKEFSCYELVIFTRHPLDLSQAKDKNTAFGRAHSNINSILNSIARFSATATLKPGETCEFPADFDELGGKCLMFDSCGSRSDDTVRCFGLLTIIELFRSEMDFARAQGAPALIEKLKAAGHYPYSDLDREPVA